MKKIMPIENIPCLSVLPLRGQTRNRRRLLSRSKRIRVACILHEPRYLASIHSGYEYMYMIACDYIEPVHKNSFLWTGSR